jgi:hypothetical protein
MSSISRSEFRGQCLSIHDTLVPFVKSKFEPGNGETVYMSWVKYVLDDDLHLPFNDASI